MVQEGGHFASCAPAFRRPLAVGLGVVTVFAATAALLLAAGHAYRGRFGPGPERVMTAASAAEDLDELLDAVKADLHGGILDSSLSDFLADEEGGEGAGTTDLGSLLDEEDDEQDSFPLGALQQKWGAAPPEGNPAAAWRQAAKAKPWVRNHAALQGLFKQADKDHSGFIEVPELADAASLVHRALDLTISRPELAAEVNTRLVDDRMGMIEFFHAVHHMLLFKRLDKDRNGLIEDGELADLRQVLSRRMGVTPERFRELSAQAGAGPHGGMGPAVLARLLAQAETDHVPPTVMHFFRKADRDHNGEIEGEELDFVSQKLRQNGAISAERYDELKRHADDNEDGKLTPRELKQLVFAGFSERQRSSLGQMPPMLRLFFLKADRDADGVIAGANETALVAGAVQKKFHISPQRYHQILAEADAGGDGRLEPQEFTHLVRLARGQGGHGPAAVARPGLHPPAAVAPQAAIATRFLRHAPHYAEQQMPTQIF